MSAFNPEIAARALIPKEILGDASSLHLCIHLSEHLMQVAVAEASGREFLWAENFEIENKRGDYRSALDFAQGRNWSDRIFRKCTLSYDTALFTPVPQAFFDVKKQNELLGFQVGKPIQNASHLSLPEIDAVMIYEQDSDVRSFIRLFPNVRIFPTAALFVKYALLSAEKDEAVLYIAHSGNTMLLSALKDKKLLLLNSFEIQNEEDVLYHASNAAMRLNLDFENIKIQLCSLSQSEALISLLKRYNKHTEYALRDEAAKVRAGFPAQLHVLCA